MVILITVNNVWKLMILQCHIGTYGTYVEKKNLLKSSLSTFPYVSRYSRISVSSSSGSKFYTAREVEGYINQYSTT